MYSSSVKALNEIDQLRDLFHATRAVLLRDLGREPEAASADEQALELTTNRAERALIEEHPAGSSSACP